LFNGLLANLENRKGAATVLSKKEPTMNSRTPMVILPLAFCLMTGWGIASEEEYLDHYSEFRVVSPERKDTGKVVFDAKADEKKILAVTIEAFGKKYELSKGELEKIAEFPLRSLTISHEAGYERTGGHMVHFRLKNGGEKVLISVTEKKGLNVTKARTPN